MNKLKTVQLVSAALVLLAPCAAHAQQASQQTSFSVVETSIPAMRQALEQKRVTSRELVRLYLERIGTYDSKLHAVITVNPRALAIADSLDRLRAQGHILGPLHGIPVALKDNVHTTDMPTTGGALAFADFVPPYEATLTKNLEAAGAIILAKTQLTELANWVASAMPGNYNGLNGYGFNPWDPRRDPRDARFDGQPVLSTGGSSSGAGTNVSFWAANIGTETSGSILSPSNQNMLVGIKPTVGRVSRYGVIPITADQDTPGPMARNVTDAAIMLGALEGAKPDPHDSATMKCPPPAGRDYTRFLNAAGLKGARIGIPRAVFYEQLNDAQKKSVEDAIAVLRAQGAIVIDSANIPSIKEFNAFPICSGLDNARGMDANCSVILKYGMKRDFNAWLKTLGDKAPVKSLTDLREWNIAHQRAGAIKYGQANLDISDEMDLRGDREKYEADRRKDILLAGTNGIDAALKANKLDALFFPGVSSAGIAARPGYPSVTVPWALLPVNGQFPAGFTPRPAPFNVTFTGTACAEPKLIELAFAFEQATKKRMAPPLFP
jgi:amidase